MPHENEYRLTIPEQKVVSWSFPTLFKVANLLYRKKRLFIACYFCISTNWVHIGNFDFHVVSQFNIADKYWESFDPGYAFPVRAHLDYIYFVFITYRDWAISFATFVLSVSRGSFLWANWIYSPQIVTLMVVIASSILSIMHKILLRVQSRNLKNINARLSKTAGRLFPSHRTIIVARKTQRFLWV